jgi:hypothetical protein
MINETLTFLVFLKSFINRLGIFLIIYESRDVVQWFVFVLAGSSIVSQSLLLSIIFLFIVEGQCLYKISSCNSQISTTFIISNLIWVGRNTVTYSVCLFIP